MPNTLTTQRILSIDAFRAITILIMIFVNDVAGVTGIPGWMQHAAADANTMTFVDIVFPAFLFIVGMSIPFALNNRKAKGDNFFQLQLHIIWRTIGLLILGVFMVNAEEGYNEAAMGMSIHLWSLCFYVCVILVWNVYRFEKKVWARVLQATGLAGLLVLGLLYKGGEDGTQHLAPHWWGILGLIGWAYLISSLLYQLVQGSIVGLLFMMLISVLWYVAGHLQAAQNIQVLQWVAAQAAHAIHTTIVLSGIALSLLFFDKPGPKTNTQRYMQAIVYAVMIGVVAYLLSKPYGISKIYATPSWALYSVMICIVLFCACYWLIDIKRYNGWTGFFKPAATNPLLVYILPVIVYHLQAMFAWYFMPEALHIGGLGIIWSLIYALIIMWSVTLLNKLKIRLQL